MKEVQKVELSIWQSPNGGYVGCLGILLFLIAFGAVLHFCAG